MLVGDGVTLGCACDCGQRDQCTIHGPARSAVYGSTAQTYNLSAESQTQKLVDALDRLTDAVTRLTEKTKS